MSYYFVKLIPHRATFAFDMSDSERALMQQHAEYWRRQMREGLVVVFGPVMDPAGPYGMGVIDAGSDAAVNEMLAHDPAASLMRTEFCPMQAVTSA